MSSCQYLWVTPSDHIILNRFIKEMEYIICRQYARVGWNTGTVNTSDDTVLNNKNALIPDFLIPV